MPVHARTAQRDRAAIGEDVPFAVVSVAVCLRLAGLAALGTHAFEQVVDLGVEIRLQQFAGPGVTERFEIALELGAVDRAIRARGPKAPPDARAAKHGHDRSSLCARPVDAPERTF